jgi:hypothetical protein
LAVPGLRMRLDERIPRLGVAPSVLDPDHRAASLPAGWQRFPAASMTGCWAMMSVFQIASLSPSTAARVIVVGGEPYPDSPSNASTVLGECVKKYPASYGGAATLSGSRVAGEPLASVPA